MSVSTGWNGVDERRSTPRIPIDEALDCRLLVRARVRLLDLSLSGALLGTEAFVPVGSQGRLNTVLIGGQFTPLIEVLRTNGRPEQQGRELGVQFQGMDDRSRHHLEGFLSKVNG